MKKFISILLTVAMMAAMMVPVLATGDLPTIDPSQAKEQFGGLTSGILGIVQWIAMAFAVGMLLYIAIKYMMSAANEKADLKKGLINYVIGAALLFGTTAILEIIRNWMNNIK